MGKPQSLITFNFVSPYDKEKRRFTRQFLGSQKPSIEDAIKRINYLNDGTLRTVKKEDLLSSKTTKKSLGKLVQSPVEPILPPPITSSIPEKVQTSVISSNQENYFDEYFDETFQNWGLDDETYSQVQINDSTQLSADLEEQNIFELENETLFYNDGEIF